MSNVLQEKFALPNTLHGKTIFDRVTHTNEKPSDGTEGFSINSGSGESEIVSLNTLTITDTPNLYKQSGEFVSEQGFVKLPRSLWNDSKWKSCRQKYKHVFLTLLFNASYTQKKFSIANNTISIEPGQFCTSLRNLIDLCNEGIRFKEDKIDKNIVERSVSLFTRFGFVRQEVRHNRSIFTITHPELYEHFQKQSETDSETKPRHNRDINEERKEREERRTNPKPLKSQSETEKSSSSFSEKNEVIKQMHEYLKKFSIKNGNEWNIDQKILQKLIEIYDENYVGNQLKYMTEQHLKGLKYQRDPVGRSVKTIDKPETYLRLACEKNYANAE